MKPKIISNTRLKLSLKIAHLTEPTLKQYTDYSNYLSSKKMNTGDYLAAKERIRNLSQQSQKVLMIVFDYPNSSNKEIAKRCFTSENSISVTLASLKAQGILTATNVTNNRQNSWRIVDQNIADTLTMNDRR